MRILHIADVHLDRPFVELARPDARARRAEVRETFRRALTIAQERDADLITIGGDLSRVPQLVVTRMGRYRPWLLAFWDFVQLVRVCPRLRLCREGVAAGRRGCFRRAVAR